MKTVRVNKRDVEAPESWTESIEMLEHVMGLYYDRRGGNMEKMSVAARVAYGMFGDEFLAADPTDALVYLMRKICLERREAGKNSRAR